MVVALPHKLNPAERRATLQPPLAYWVIELGRPFVGPTKHTDGKSADDLVETFDDVNQIFV